MFFTIQTVELIKYVDQAQKTPFLELDISKTPKIIEKLQKSFFSLLLNLNWFLFENLDTINTFEVTKYHFGHFLLFLKLF